MTIRIPKYEVLELFLVVAILTESLCDNMLVDSTERVGT